MDVLICDNPECRFALDEAYLWCEPAGWCAACGVGETMLIWTVTPPPNLARQGDSDRLGRRLTPAEYAALQPLIEHERRRCIAAAAAARAAAAR